MALSQAQVNALAQAMAASRTASGSMTVGDQAIQRQQPTVEAPKQKRLGFAGQIIDKASKVATQTPRVLGQIAKSIGGFAAKEVAELPGEIYRTATRVVPTMTGGGLYNDVAIHQKGIEALDKAQSEIVNSYKSGRISKEEYSTALRDLSKGYQDLSADSKVIQANADPTRAAEDFVDTALLLTTFGIGKVGSAAVRPTGAFLGGAGEKTLALATKVNLGIEDALKKIPGSYFEKLLADPATGAVVKQTLGGNVKEGLTKLLIKYPLTYHMTFSDIGKIAGDLGRGNLGGAATTALLDATVLLSGPIGAAFQGIKRLGLSTKGALFGRGSAIDELSGLLFQDRAAIASHINDLKLSNPAAYDRAVGEEGWLRSWQAMNLHTAKGDPREAAQGIVRFFDSQGGYRPQSAEELFKSLEGYGETLKGVHNDIKFNLVDNVPMDKRGEVLLGRLDQSARDQLAADILKVGAPKKGTKLVDAKARIKAFLEGAAENNVAWAHSETLMTRLNEIVDSATSVSKIGRAIKDIDAQAMIGKGWSKETRALFKEHGYVPIVPKRITDSRYIAPDKAGKVTSNFIDDAANIDQAVAPLPGFERLGSALRRAGLSPEDTNASANRMLHDNLNNALADIEIPKMLGEDKATWVKKQLRAYMDTLPTHPTLTVKNMVTQDARFLRADEVAKALGVTPDVARSVQKGLLQAYTSMPFAVRGLGDKLVDYAYSIPVTGALHRAYSRVQGALRYSWNPFFRLQEVTETELLSQMLAGGKVPSYFGANKVISMFFKKTAKEIDDTVDLLKEKNVFAGTLTGEAADSQVIGRISANMTKTQQKSLAGFALKIAKAKGIGIDELMGEHYDEVVDALRIVVQYPRQGGINSPLARTINIAFFPTRYNLKVAGLAASVLAKQAPAVQLGVVNGLMDMKEWLKTDEGIKWQSDNQDAIQVWKWLTPYGNLEWAMNKLGGNVPDSIGEIGMLGGLPFGLISQMFDSQTDFELNTPYVDLRTGKVFPEYIPQTLKARGATALQDLIGLSFNYPGRLLGLPGKAELIRNGVKAFVPVDKGEYKIVSPEDNLTSTQKRQVEVIEGYRNADPRAEERPVFDGYSWDERGYYIPMDVLEKARATTPNAAPTPVRVPTREEIATAKRSKSGNRTKRVARPIENS